MKKIKNLLTATISAIVLSISTVAFAYGSQVDTLNVITMPKTLENGKGSVTTSLSGDMKYQFVEITSEKYNLLKKYEAQYNLIKAYIDDDANYDAMVEEYENTYNATANSILSEYEIQFNEQGYDVVKSTWISELTNYNESAWENASNKNITLDLSTFDGTKYYIAWVEVDGTYDAEVYKVTGTKVDEPKNEIKNEVKNETKNETKNEAKNEPKNETPAPIQNKQKEDNTTVKQSIPYTGVSSAIFGLIATAGTLAGISYKKYTNIK